MAQSIAKDVWDGLLRQEESPFLEYDWIYCMEESDCATVDTGEDGILRRAQPTGSMTSFDATRSSGDRGDMLS